MFEIRNYHFVPEKIDAYENWAKTLALPYLKSKMDVVGFWINNDLAPEYAGSFPRSDSIGTANVTWIIRWQDKSQRDTVWDEIRSGSEWQEIFSKVPGGRENYIRIEAKFATDILKGIS